MRLAKNINQVTLLGTVITDPTLHSTPDGTSVLSFTVCTTRRFKNAAGEKKDETEYTRISAWDKLAQIGGQIIFKGTKAFIIGRLKTIKSVDKEGKDRYTTEVVAGDIIVVSRPEDSLRFDSEFDQITKDQ